MCPCCGYEEEENWRSKPHKAAVDILEGVECKLDIRAGETKVVGQWVYHKTSTGKWVERMLVPVWESWGCKFSFPKGFYDKNRHGKDTINYKMRVAYYRNIASEKHQTKLGNLK